MPEQETLRPVAWTFGAFGAFWGTWAVAAVDVERRLHLTYGRLGLLLTLSVAAGGVLAAAFGGVTHRMGTGRALAGALGVWGACVMGAALAPGQAAFFVMFVAAMVVAGTVDAAMNTAVALGARGDGATMVRFHALFNMGALVGAAATGLLLYAGGTWRVAWGAVAVVCFGLALSARRAPLPGAHPDPPSVPGPDATTGRARVGRDRFGWRAVRASGLGTLATAFFCTALVEGGIDTWGVLYLRTHLHAAALLGAGAYALGQAIAVTVRWSSAGQIRRVGARAGLLTGTVVAAGGLALEAGAPGAALAGLGLLVAIGGIALCWPLVMAVVSAGPPGAASHVDADPARRAPSAAAAVPDPSGDAAPASSGAAMAALVGAFTAVGYLGWVAGPGIVGWVADTWSLGAGLALLAAVAAAAAVLLLATPGRSGAR